MSKELRPSRRERRTWKKLLVASLLVTLLVAWFCHLVYQNSLASRLKQQGATIQYSGGSVVSVWFRGEDCRFNDSEMASLIWFPQLESLDVDDTQVTNSGLVHVKDLSQLTRLSVRVRQITDQREKELKKEMRYLIIQKTQKIGGRRVVDGFQ